MSKGDYDNLFQLVTVTVNSVATTYTSADGAKQLRLDSDLAQNALTFAYEPGVGDTGYAELSGFRRYAGFSMIVRKVRAEGRT